MGRKPYQLVLLYLCFRALAGAADWRPINPEDFALKAPRVEKDASAEALFWEIRLKDNLSGGRAQIELSHYIRIKIFTDKGRDNATAEILYWNKTNISAIAGRTVKPDGTVIEMEKDAIFDKNVIKAGGIKIKAKSFVLPNVAPGDIIEYKWRETRDDQLSNNLRLPLQRNIPIEHVRYIIKPLQVPYLPYAMRALYLQAPNNPFVPAGGGFSAVDFENMPAFHEEEHMPPEEAVRASLLIYYSPDTETSAARFWSSYGRQAYQNTRELIKVNADVKRASVEALEGASNDEQKIRKIFDYCRTKIRNTISTQGDVTPDEINSMKDNGSPAATLKQGIGTGRDINLLFAAMLLADGLDARVARVGDAATAPMGPFPSNGYFLPILDVAVNVNGKWQFYDPGTPGLPFGMLRWQEEGMPALLTDAKDPQLISSSHVPATQNLHKRTATLALGLDGSISGTVRDEWTGQPAYEERRRWSGKTESDCEKMVTEAIAAYASTAEVTNLKIEHRDNLDQPLAVSFRLALPGYATRTGKRILFQPALFHSNRNALFSSSTRVNPVFFPFAWTEEDTVSIAMPPGFALDHADVPAPIKVGSTIQYEIKANVVGGKTFVYHRTFRVGEGGEVILPATAYPSVKKIFDAVQESDNHSITLKVEDKVATK